jgi:anaerobic magnesium-protoporphyrin IX monomethyl ester cyclase
LGGAGRAAMKVTLVNPPTLVNVRSLGTMKPTLPLGLAYVAAAARSAGHEVSVVDAVARAPQRASRDGILLRIGADVDEIVDAIPEDTDVIGVTCLFSFLWPLVRQLLRAIKQRRPDALLVCGGEHFTALPERALAEAPVDAIVVGEGEETFVELLANVEAGDRRFDRVAGLVFRRAGGVHRTPRRARTRDVDAIAPPAWDLFDPDTYNENDFSLGMRLGYSIPILATRGCPYECTFCTSPNMWTQRWYPRSPEKVVEEIETWHERYGATNFPFHDLTAVIRRRWIVDFCRRLVARGLRIRWQLPVGTRCEAFDEEVARLMVRSGCEYLAFAPESGSERVRDVIKKKMSRDSLVDAVRVAVDAGMHVTCSFMIGMPEDRVDDYRETAALVRELARLGVEDISCHYFYPAPGSRMYHDLAEAGRLRNDDEELMSALLNTDWVQRSQHAYCEAVPPRTLAAWRYRIFASFYATRLARRPGAALSLLANVARGRETNKLEALAREVRQRVRLRAAGSSPRVVS